MPSLYMSAAMQERAKRKPQLLKKELVAQVIPLFQHQKPLKLNFHKRNQLLFLLFGISARVCLWLRRGMYSWA